MCWSLLEKQQAARKTNKLMKGMGCSGENAAKQAKRHSLFAASCSLVSSQSTSALTQLEANFDGGWFDDASSPRDGLLLLHENWLEVTETAYVVWEHSERAGHGLKWKAPPPPSAASEHPQRGTTTRDSQHPKLRSTEVCPPDGAGKASGKSTEVTTAGTVEEARPRTTRTGGNTHQIGRHSKRLWQAVAVPAAVAIG